MAFEEFGFDVDIDDLHAALRRAYHHGGWGMDGGFDPTEETSFQRTVADRRGRHRRARAAADAGGVLSAPERALHGDQPLAHLSRCVSDADRAQGARAWSSGRSATGSGTCPSCSTRSTSSATFDFIAASARIGFEKPHPRIFQWALEQADVPAESVIHVGDHVDADVEGARGVGIEGVLIDRANRFAARGRSRRRPGHPLARRAAADRGCAPRRTDDAPSAGAASWRCRSARRCATTCAPPSTDGAAARTSPACAGPIRRRGTSPWPSSGRSTPRRSPALIERLATVAEAHRGDELDDRWPRRASRAPARARVAWYGIEDADGRLARLAADVAVALGLDASRPLRPHLTLARARRRAGRPAAVAGVRIGAGRRARRPIGSS